MKVVPAAFSIWTKANIILSLSCRNSFGSEYWPHPNFRDTSLLRSWPSVEAPQIFRLQFFRDFGTAKCSVSLWQELTSAGGAALMARSSRAYQLKILSRKGAGGKSSLACYSTGSSRGGFGRAVKFLRTSIIPSCSFNVIVVAVSPLL